MPDVRARYPELIRLAPPGNDEPPTIVGQACEACGRRSFPPDPYGCEACGAPVEQLARTELALSPDKACELIHDFDSALEADSGRTVVKWSDVVRWAPAMDGGDPLCPLIEPSAAQLTAAACTGTVPTDTFRSLPADSGLTNSVPNHWAWSDRRDVADRAVSHRFPLDSWDRYDPPADAEAIYHRQLAESAIPV